ncbi:MAG: hypothetical protein V8Q42_01440 [Anaerovoracaceae bacterium]
MATPAVTGTVALTAAELKNADASTLANAVMSYVDESPMSSRAKWYQEDRLISAGYTDPAPRIGTGKSICG